MTLVASDVRRPGEPLVAGARPIRSVPSRSQPARPKKAAPGEARQFRRWLLGSSLYSLTLGYGTPRSFFAVAPDTWPGDQAVGRRLIGGELAARGAAGPVAPDSDDPPWQRPGAPALWLDALNGFDWLRDLRDCGDLSAASLAVRLVDDWINHEWRWSPLTWRREVLAERIVSWIRHYDWLATAADPGFAARFVFALGRQRAHLKRVLRSGLVGHEAVAGFKALIFADLAFLRDGKRYERSLEQTLTRLARFVKRYVLHDGIVAERAPHLQLAVLRHLLDVRAALASAERRAPAELIAAIDRLAPMLRFFRHGDGGLALFNGAWEGDRTLTDLVLARSGSGEARADDGAGQRLPAAGLRHLAGDRRCRQPAGPRHGRHRPCRYAVVRDERRARAADRELRHLSRRAARLAALHALHRRALDGGGRRHQFD